MFYSDAILFGAARFKRTTMTRIFYTAAILAILCSPGRGIAQMRVHWGAATTLQFKGQLFPDKANRYSPWGGGGIYLMNIIEGEGERSLALATKAGLVLDFETYTFSEFHKFSVDKVMFELNPEVLFPLASERAMISAGIGGDVHLESRISIDGVSGTDINAAYYYGNFEHKERHIIPFISLGYLLQLGNVHLQFSLKQNMQRSYYRNESINLGDDISPIIIKLGHQPTYLSFSLWYVFGGVD